MPATILVGVDGTELSLRAVEHVARVMSRGQVVLCHVAPIPPRVLEHRGAESPGKEQRLERETADESRDYRQDIEQVIERDIFRGARERFSSQAPDPQVELRTLVLTEPHQQVAEALVGEARSRRYDALVIGWNQQGALGRLLQGSVSSKLSDSLRECPLWLVP